MNAADELERVLSEAIRRLDDRDRPVTPTQLLMADKASPRHLHAVP